MRSALVFVVLFFCFCFCCLQSLQSQCPTGNIIYSTQAEINDFLILYPDCSEFSGNIIIGGDQLNTNYDITNLNGLQNLTIIEGSLAVYFTSGLTSFTGLENLSSIGGNLNISVNDGLSSLDGLQNLSAVEGYLRIYANEDLTSLEGLQNLSAVGSYLKIQNNDALTSLEGLQNLSSIGDYLSISYHDALVSLEGFQNLSTVGGYVNIVYNSVLTSLNGLQNLSTIEGGVEIRYNNALTSLNGFESLSNIGGYVNIGYNDALVSLNGLQSLSNIGGSVNIRYNDVLTSLIGLQNLSTIGGGLIISSNDALNSLEAIQNLSTIEGDLNIDNNVALSSLDGLQNLSVLAGSLKISNNDALTSLEALQSLSALGGININNNNTLTSLNGLQNLSIMGGDLIVQNNDALTSLNSFQNISTVEGDLYIGHNDALSSLNELHNLVSVDGYFSIYSNDALTSLNGLHNLVSVGEFLSISFNDALTSLDGFQSLSTIGEYLKIRHNDALSSCSISPICNLLASGTEATIESNASGCLSEAEILSNCEGLGKIHFPIFYDINENTVQDSGEPFLPTASVVIEPEGYTVYGNTSNGGFKYLQLGNYTISYDESTSPLWELTTSPVVYDFTLDSLDNTDTVYYGLTPTVSISDIATATVNGLPRCNEHVVFDVIANNNGTTIADGTIWFTIDSNILDVTYIDPPDTLIAPNVYGWHFTDLFPGGIEKRQISLQLPGPPNFPIGDRLNFGTIINFEDENGLHENDLNIHRVEVQCSFDPNDKLITSQAPDNYALIGEDLIYTVRFQNTGNAEAYDVVITDELDPNLDLSTFQYITSSHESVLSTFIEGNLLTFEFKDIFLPDSTTNFDESQGYVMYSIRALDTLSDFSTIENTANIFFDYNPAVVTNTTESVMVETFDADGDGFEFWIDCDDNDFYVNSAMMEEPYNGIDDDCDPATLDDDLDQDGFVNAEDCDDNNALVNVGEEEPYNGIDDDCDPTTLDDDLDQDGFVNAEDCDDNNALVNPNTPEIPYNGLNDDCNEATLDDDLDQDGFPLADDCDDNNMTVNPEGIEIANNGIDEDCDGEDLILIATDDILTIKPQIFPNPTSGSLQIRFPETIQGTCELRTLTGKLLLKNTLGETTTLNLSHLPQGVYLLLLKTDAELWTERVVKGKF